jgi:hypothetical protein
VAQDIIDRVLESRPFEFEDEKGHPPLNVVHAGVVSAVMSGQAGSRVGQCANLRANAGVPQLIEYGDE